jgi:hypothetical protein
MDLNRREREFLCNFSILNCSSLLQRFTLDPLRDDETNDAIAEPQP